MDYEIEQVKKALSLKMDRELTKEEEAFTEYNHETVIGIMSMFGEKLKQIEDLLESQRDRVRFVKMRWKAVDNQRKAYYKMLEKAVPNYFTKTFKQEEETCEINSILRDIEDFRDKAYNSYGNYGNWEDVLKIEYNKFEDRLEKEGISND